MGLLDELRQYARLYIANISQVGVLAPAPVVVCFNSIGSLVWTYSAVGTYFLDSDGQFVNGRTFALFAPGEIATPPKITWQRISDTRLAFYTRTVADALADVLLVDATIVVGVTQ